MGNYEIGYIHSVYCSEGWYDTFIYEDQDDAHKKPLVDHRRECIPKIGTNYVYEFIMIPNDPFLNENQPLPPGVELQLSFDRLTAEFSTYNLSSKTDELKGKTLKLKNVYAQAEYITSTALRQYADSIENSPAKFKYDECSVMYKALPTGDQSIRLENIKGGKTPDYLFIGIMKTAALNGKTDEASLKFKCHNIKDINLTLNGNSCTGFPMKINNNYPIEPYFKYYDVLGKLQNNNISTQMTMKQFQNNMIHAHKFEGEDCDQGWLSVSLSTKSNTGFAAGYTLGKPSYNFSLNILTFSFMDCPQG